MGLLSFFLFSAKGFIAVLKSFLPSVEGFSPVAIWDYKQWSWGYGTAAGFDPNKRPVGTITREKAWSDAQKAIQANYSALKSYVKRELSPQQWAALLSFAYNAGVGNARNIVSTINVGTELDVVTRMKKYVYAGGKLNQGLVNRREKEAMLYMGHTALSGAFFEPKFSVRVHPDQVGEFAY